MKLSRVSILENGRENLKLDVVLVVVLFLDSKALLFGMNTGYVCNLWIFLKGNIIFTSGKHFRLAECMTYNRMLSAIPPVTMAKANSHLKKKKKKPCSGLEEKSRRELSSACPEVTY